MDFSIVSYSLVVSRSPTNIYHSGYQILATDYWSQVMTAFVAVSLTLTSPYVFKIFVKDVLYRVWSKIQLRSERPTDSSSGEHQPLVPEQPRVDYGAASQTNTSRAENPKDILAKAESSRDAAWEFFQYVLKGGPRPLKYQTTYIIIVTTLLFGLFVVWTIAGVFSVRIATDRAALASSEFCGIWRFDEKAGEEADYRDDLENSRKEALASQYARNCYNSVDAVKALGCSFFYNQSIAFTTKSRQRCPFEPFSLCHDGLYSAVTFDTGYVDASLIGINTPVTNQFRRKTTCSPLTMTEPYVRRETPEGSNYTIYNYYFGSTEFTNFTLSTSGNSFDWPIPVYSVK